MKWSTVLVLASAVASQAVAVKSSSTTTTHKPSTTSTSTSTSHTSTHTSTTTSTHHASSSSTASSKTSARSSSSSSSRVSSSSASSATDSSEAATTGTATSACFNNEVRFLFDTNGNQIDAYGAKINYFNGSYYMYGNGFGEIGTADGINAYRSADLQTWESLGNILDSALNAYCLAEADNGGCGRPHMLYNSNSTKYVLWMNGGEPGYVVATASSPAGPFAQEGMATVDPNFTEEYGYVQADFAVEQSSNGSAYIVFSALQFEISDAGSIWPPIKQTLHMSALTSDYLSTTDVSYPVRSSADDLIDMETESPDLFFRNGEFYVAASNTCGYCNSSIGLIYRSSSIEGPWTRNIISADGCGGQVEGVLPLTLPGSTEVTYLWHSTSVPGGPRTGFGGHIFQPLVFNSDGSVQDLNCASTAEFTVEFTKGTVPVTTGTLLTTAKDYTPIGVEYDYVCDSDQWELFQLWESNHTGYLESVSVNVARGSQTVDLTLKVFTNLTSFSSIVPASFVWETLGSEAFAPANLTYVFDVATVVLDTPVKVTKGQILGLDIVGADYSPYCHMEWNSAAYESEFKLFQRGTGQNSLRGLAGTTSPVYERIGKSVKFQANYSS